MLITEEFLAELENKLTVADWLRLYFHVNTKIDLLRLTTKNFASAKWNAKNLERTRENNRNQYLKFKEKGKSVSS